MALNVNGQRLVLYVEVSANVPIQGVAVVNSPWFLLFILESGKHRLPLHKFKIYFPIIPSFTQTLPKEISTEYVNKCLVEMISAERSQHIWLQY